MVPTSGILSEKNLIYYGVKEEPEDIKNYIINHMVQQILEIKYSLL